MHLFRKTVVYTLIASVFSLSLPVIAQAEMIGTLAGLEAEQRHASMAKLNDLLAKDHVREEMRALGVNEAQVEARLAALTTSELNQLAHDIDTMPAGAGLIEIVGITFIVLLILEAVGVIDIFKKFP